MRDCFYSWGAPEGLDADGEQAGLEVGAGGLHGGPALRRAQRDCVDLRQEKGVDEHCRPHSLPRPARAGARAPGPCAAVGEWNLEPPQSGAGKKKPFMSKGWY